MENDLSALYEVLIKKTRFDQLNWQRDANGKSLTTSVGDLLVRVSGLHLAAVQSGQNQMAVISNPVDRFQSLKIAVYDNQTELVAKGGNQAAANISALMIGLRQRNGEIEDISSPKLSELASILEKRYRRFSVTSKLLETLKAS